MPKTVIDRDRMAQLYENIMFENQDRPFTSRESLAIEYLGEMGVKIQEAGLARATDTGRFTLVQYMVEKGQTKPHNWVSWVLANPARRGRLDVVKYLVERGADINARCARAVSAAADNGQSEVLAYLLERGGWLPTKADIASWIEFRNRDM